MQSNIDISVIIPVYGVEKYLQECIDSLMGQTKKNIEFIFINDASPDNCLQILRENEKKYGGVLKVIDSPENLRQGGARNLGLKAARGEYVGFVDGDDWVSENMYQSLWDAVKFQDADAAFVNYKRVQDKADVLANADVLIKPSKELLSLHNKLLTDKDRIELMCSSLGGVVCGIFRKSLLLDNELFFPEKLRYEDNYWSTLLRCYLTKVSFIFDETCYYYRYNLASTTNTMDQSYQYDDRVIIENMLIEDAKNRGVFSLFKQGFEYIYTKRYALITFEVLNTKFAKISDKSKMRRLFLDLKKEFPRWRKNVFYKKNFTKKEKIRNFMVINFPVFMAHFYRLKKRLLE